MIASITHIEKESLKKDKISQRDRLEKQYKNRILSIEENSYKDIASIWHHNGLEKEDIDSVTSNVQLFSQESVEIFGLDKKELIKMATIAGLYPGLE